MQSIISLTFDDGLLCQFESALPILNSHGIRATFFLIANRNPTHDLWSGHTHDWWKIQWRDDDVAMLRRLVQDGHEIGSHSVTHHPTEMPKQAALEACESKKLIEGWIGTRVSSFCYPFYRSHAFLADAVKDAGYEQARGGGTPPLYEPGASYYAISDAARFDRFNVDCRQISKNEERWRMVTSRMLARFDVSRGRRRARWMGTDHCRAIRSPDCSTSQVQGFRCRRNRHFRGRCSALAPVGMRSLELALPRLLPQ